MVVPRIVSNRSYRLILLKKQRAFVSGYMADKPEERLIVYLPNVNGEGTQVASGRKQTV